MKILYRINSYTATLIADNLVDFMVSDKPLSEKSVSFLYCWVSQPNGTGKSKGFYDVWDIVLQKYLPKERPILFRSCERLSNRTIQSFTGKIHSAYKFSDGQKGHLLICDTNEYLSFESEYAIKHYRSFFPLNECIKKASNSFSPSFCEMCEKEDEYIVRVNNDWLYDFKWNKK